MKDSCGREITYLRLSVTDRCNLRCRYCMPDDGLCMKKHADMLTEDEMVTAVEVAASLGISKLRITGGEPLVKKNIVSICERTAAVEGIDELCLTTNGILLPQYAKDLKAAGVSRLNISLDTLNADKYRYITRREEFKNACEGIKAAIDAGFTGTKINTVLIGGFNDDEITELCELTVKYPVDLRFIELMPMYDSGDFDKNAYLPASAVLDKMPMLEKLSDEGVAHLYRMPGALGRIGLISPVSNHFCDRCNRLRLTADGMLRPCLHSQLEYSIKGLNKDEMLAQFIKAIEMKPDRHSELSYESRSEAGRNMNRIGG